MTLTRDDVLKVANLARLRLSDAEIELLRPQLTAILGYVELLNEVDTSTVEPLAHCLALQNVFRDDAPSPSLSVEQALANAPKRMDDFFSVPPILE